MSDFEADFLPEHLWIASLCEAYGPSDAHPPFMEFLDALDEFHVDDLPLLGLITDFGAISVSERGAFLEKHAALVRDAFQEPFGRLLAFYPESPASWLVTDDFLAHGGSLDPAVELPRMRNLVLQLIQAKDQLAGHIRTLPMVRLLKHGKIYFRQGLELPDIMPNYSYEAPKDLRWKVQSFARMTVNRVLEENHRYEERTWPKYFWRHNYDLVTCQPVFIPLGGSPSTVPESFINELDSLMRRNADRARDYLDILRASVRVDLYRPERDEILFGLMARVVRLYTLIADYPYLWARDVAGIMLRCLADTVITFGYLAAAGAAEDFARFRAYGEGQEKLLMLHLQDSHAGSRSLEGRSADAIAEGLGHFVPEVLPIELGSWSGKDARRLATQAGMEDLYRLVFNPASSDVHGTWHSLKQANLCHCAEPLHRFHRLPAFLQPPLYVDTVMAAQRLLQRAIDTAVHHLSYPEPRSAFEDVPEPAGAEDPDE